MNSSELGVGGLRSSHRQRQRRIRGCLAVLVALGVLLGLGVFVYVKGVDLLSQSLAGPDDYAGNGSGRVVVQVKDGDTSTDIGQTLYRRKVVASVEAFTDVAREDSRARDIQVGYYTLKKRMSAKSALALLLDPASRGTSTVTIPEGMTVDETVDLLARKTKIPTPEFAAALRRPARLGLPPYAHGNPEGFLYPATYNLPPNADADGVLSLLVDRYVDEARSVRLVGRAKELGLTPHQALTLASYAQAEVNRDKYMPRVARTVLNRLQDGQRFELDSTGPYGYGAQLADSKVAPPSVRAKADLYDTYRHAGWTPGPVNSPGIVALRAAVDPADGPWRYFVTTNLDTGETHFSKTFGEHSKWVRQYRRYCRTSDHC